VLVCHCRAVCDRTIRQCVRSGTTSLEGIGECTGAGTGCGGCQDAILDIVEGEEGEPSLRKLPMFSEVA
jgi:bacterioferritin-associated ferredoxin